MIEERKQLRKKLASYNVQKNELAKLKRKLKNKKLKDYEKQEIKTQIRYIETYVSEVKQILKKFEKLCGKQCLKFVKEIYIDGNKVNDVARKYNMSRRKLEAYLTFWVEKCYLADHKPAQKETPWTI